MKNDGNRRRTVPRQRVGRPEPRTAMERAQRIADDRDGMREMYERACELEARFWSGFEPPFDDADGGDDAKAADEPADDTIIHMPEVLRQTGMSQCSLYRMTRDGRFPAAMQLSEHRVGWKAGDIKAWVEERPRQRVFRRRPR
jgi:prophage regulatory protein